MGKKGSFFKEPETSGTGVFLGGDVHFNGYEQFQILVETKPEIIRKFLPQPLQPIEEPYVFFVAANFKDIDYPGGLKEGGYLETALAIPCEYKGGVGLYYLAMHLNSDMPTFYGREVWGYPKKMGNIRYYDGGDVFYAGEERKGIPFLSMFGKLDGVPNSPDFTTFMNKFTTKHPTIPNHGVNFTTRWLNGFHTFENAEKGDTNLFLQKPVLIMAPDITTDIGVASRVGSADLKVIWSDDDPWADIEIIRILGCSVDVCDYVMCGKYDMFDLDEEEFKKHAFYGYDYCGGHRYDKPYVNQSYK